MFHYRIRTRIVMVYRLIISVAKQKTYRIRTRIVMVYLIFYSIKKRGIFSIRTRIVMVYLPKLSPLAALK